MFGGYWGQPVAGKWEFAPGVPMHSLFLWQPYFGYVDNYNRSPIGWLFYPAVYLDQHFVHRPYDLMNTNDADVLFSKDSHIKWHPEAIKQAKKNDMENAAWRSHCIEDPEFCLQSARDVHTRKDEHFIALSLCDKFGTNALFKLQSLSDNEKEGVTKRPIVRVMDEVQNIMNQAGTNAMTHYQ
jgi:hypothetical protein